MQAGVLLLGTLVIIARAVCFGGFARPQWQRHESRATECRPLLCSLSRERLLGCIVASVLSASSAGDQFPAWTEASRPLMTACVPVPGPAACSCLLLLQRLR